MLSLGNPFGGNVNIFGLAIIGNRPQKHASLVYKDEGSGQLMLLHLATHNDLRCHPIRDPYYLVTCPYLEGEEDYWAEIADRVRAENPAGIPYGLKYSGDKHFSDAGKFLNSRGAGLTCATFVVAFLKDYGFSFLDLSSWQPRPASTKWQLWAFGNVINNTPDKDYVSTQAGLVGRVPRFAPEEVIASGHMYDGQLIKMTEAIQYGELLVREIQSHFPAPAA